MCLQGWSSVQACRKQVWSPVQRANSLNRLAGGRLGHCTPAAASPEGTISPARPPLSYAVAHYISLRIYSDATALKMERITHRTISARVYHEPKQPSAVYDPGTRYHTVCPAEQLHEDNSLRLRKPVLQLSTLPEVPQACEGSISTVPTQTI
jgi:hypothetical protein